MTTTKRVKREVIGISASRDLTKQGNPKDYWYVLECGHTTHEHHSARTHLQYMLMTEVKDHDFKFKKFCWNCQAGRPVKEDSTFNVIGWFRASELNDNIIDMYKKFKPQTA